MTVPSSIARKTLAESMPEEQFLQIVDETDKLLERRLKKVSQLVDAKSTDVNLNPFLMLALAPAYNIYSPYEAAEHLQHSKLHHGDATAFGKFIEANILPFFGVSDPPEKKAQPDLYSPIDVQITVEDRRFLMVEQGTGNYTHTLVGHEFWEFVTGVREAHLEIFRAIKAAQGQFSARHEGRTFYEQMVEARLALSASIRDAFDLEGEETEMWEKIFVGSF